MQPLPIGPEHIPLSGGVAGAPKPGAPAEGPGFKQMLEGYMDQVNQLQQEAGKTVVDLATGKMDNLHQVVAALSEADLSFRLMMQVRNKLVEAYKEIMRMQV